MTFKNYVKAVYEVRIWSQHSANIDQIVFGATDIVVILCVDCEEATAKNTKFYLFIDLCFIY